MLILSGTPKKITLEVTRSVIERNLIPQLRGDVAEHSTTEDR